ncbi:hypothetical protein EDI_272160 [Entamoeba dispar SAW760]|uniref:Phosphoglycolate phosphatase n=1 Tax=Entamoeba dispar (strain ATCC PRA-260 / SAW760) TaxID=370354 RepID=B0EFL7_ENTDS|nr:uncharacterized protein EDI_272160 [Entamoeba dispar SAW760]EDR26699.1 hypothetical protein EDI_272160 [Entamoeba dispar SAW760]|eukprot:EDR26699.1 hypothetical protein EDI_272160 [Entamoeba dispar SAW760]
MPIRYKCIVIDHDDTTVDSTPSIHYPAYLDFANSVMKGRDYKILSLQEWYRMLWDYDYFEYIRDVMKLNKEEQDLEYKLWLEYTATRHPQMFPGFLEMLIEYKKQGGIVCVCSHSHAKDIKRHYEEHNFIPDEIFGSVRGHPELCKPYTYPIDTIKEKYHLKPSEIVVIDDLAPGFTMAKSAGVDAIGVLYGEGHELVEDDIKKVCKYVFNTVSDLSNFLLNPVEP